MKDAKGNEMLRVFRFDGYHNSRLIVAAKTKNQALLIAGNKFSLFIKTMAINHEAEKRTNFVHSIKGVCATGKARVL